MGNVLFEFHRHETIVKKGKGKSGAMHNNDALDYQTIVIKMNDGSLSVHVYRRTQSGSYATDFIGESRMRGPPRPPLQRRSGMCPTICVPEEEE